MSKLDRQASQPAEFTAPRVVLKGQQSFRHDLFKAKVAMLKKNLTSWKTGEPSIIEMEHAHMFHSHNSRGKVQTRTTATGGHFHDVKTFIDPKTGEIRAECGPPLKIVQEKRGNNYRDFVRPIKFIDKRGDQDREILDTHTHEMEYLHSEELSPDRIEQKKRSDVEAMSVSFAQAQKMVHETAQGPRSGSAKAEDLEISGV